MTCSAPELVRRRHGLARARSRRDDSAGFSVTELLVALTILVITLVALMRLATTSSFMVSTSTQRSAMVNAAAGYLERVRQEPYANIGVPGGDPTGVLVSEVTTVAPYVITITPTVAWGRPENPATHLLKTVTLAVSSRGLSGGSEMEFVSSALVADVGIVGMAAAPSAGVPVCAVVSPGAGAVVWGPTVSVTASATVSGAGRSLLWMDMLDGVQSWGSTVMSGTSGQHTWIWNTTTAREGNHSITARATDNSNRVGNSAAVVLLVDNAAPTVPAQFGATFAGDTGASIWWSPSTDGTDVDGVTPLAASHYVLQVYRQPADVALAGDYSRWSAVAGLNPVSMQQAPASGAPLGLSGFNAFGRYALSVSSSSPDRGAEHGLISSPSVLTGITQYPVVGAWTVSASGGRYDVSVALRAPSSPTFPWVGTATTSFYRLTSPTQPVSSGTLVGTVTSASPAWSSSVAVVDSSQTRVREPVRYWYVASTTLTPAGFGGTQTAVRSCVLAAPADIVTPGTRDLVFAQW